jgi:hypothetical protein
MSRKRILVALFASLLILSGLPNTDAAPPRYVIAYTDAETLAQTEADFARQFIKHNQLSGKSFNDLLVLRVREIVNGYSSWRWDNEPRTPAELGFTRAEYMAYHKGRADELIQLQSVNGEWIFKNPPTENEWLYIVAAFKQQCNYPEEVASVNEDGEEIMIPNPQPTEDFIPEQVNKYIEDIRIADDSVKWDKKELPQADYDAVSGDKKAGLEALKEERKLKKVKIEKKDQ